MPVYKYMLAYKEKMAFKMIKLDHYKINLQGNIFLAGTRNIFFFPNGFFFWGGGLKKAKALVLPNVI